VRTLVVSDVHSNIEGLRAAVADAAAAGPVDAVWCSGDIVGYGADPAAVIALLRECGATIVAGNHDLASSGLMGVEEFNTVAAAAVRWTAGALSQDERDFLSALPLVREIGDFTLVHGSLRAPEWEYLLEPEQAAAQFALQPTPYSIVGHSHLQFAVVEPEGGRLPRFREMRDGESLKLSGARLILNAGSTGQPRDGDPRAGYMIIDDADGIVSWHRVEYDVAAAQEKIGAAGLPPFLASRLSAGR
jgi:diadenosine tetraphosphatase ApaH/serine/threonine PP2A family protein phosphatase